MSRTSNFSPDYAAMSGWEVYSKNLGIEYEQSVDEGLDIERYQKLFDAVNDMPDGPEKEEMADVLFRIVNDAGTKDGYPYVEPSDLGGIKALRDGRSFVCSVSDKDVLKDRINGAWLGRIAGCLLGKLFEGTWALSIVPFLKETGNYPMHRYVLRTDVKGDILARYYIDADRPWYADEIPCAPVDDDTNYTVLAQRLIEKYGRSFTTENVAENWILLQSKDSYCTAERVAFCNLIRGFRPPLTATYKNAYREWIGAQIRADYYGYINPGDPQTAADMAWRDASLSHIKNGIYGAMFVAAMLACAAVCDNVRDVIFGGLAEIPKTSRLYKHVSDIISLFDQGKSFEDAVGHINEAFNEHTGHGWCHTISNAMIVTAALLYGEGDYGKTVGLAVQTGYDTDCNGATAGSVFGMLHGAGSIGPEWTGPLHGKLSTSIFGTDDADIAELVEKTLTHLPQ